jgi:YidC/Oxa1 family membrane protein insertase
MEKRFLVAIAFSVLILTLYPYIINKLYPRQQISQAPQTLYKTILHKEAEVLPEKPEQPGMPNATEEKEIDLENKFVRLVFSPYTATMSKVFLKEAPGLKEGELLLLDASHSENRPFLTNLGIIPYKQASYNFVKAKNKILFSATLEENINIEKVATLSENEPLLTLDMRIENTSDNEKTFTYSIVGPTKLRSEFKQDEKLLTFNIKSTNTVFREPAFKLKQGKTYKGEFPWVCSKNRYFCIVVKPASQVKEVSIAGVNGDTFLTLSDGSITLPPHESIEFSYLAYIGPARLSVLKKYGFQEILNFGLFDPIGKLLLWMLIAFYSITKNYGIAIILLTIMTSITLFPLSMKSINSMKQMQQLQPQLEKLRQECKDNPQKLNKEMMALYKKHKINPLGGCLPMLLQMPIFIALYQLILISVELKGASFLWIKDLSLQDNLRIPFALPVAGNHINLLPILMIIAMFVQQKFTNPMAKTQDEQAKMLSFIMPIMFGFIFYSLPSALVLYWFTNTLIMSVLQFMALRPALASLVGTKERGR